MTATFNTVRLERDAHVALRTLNRPERLSAMNREMLTELQAALDDVERDAEVRAVLLTGEGANFSSGFDLKEQMEIRPSEVSAWREILDRDFGTVMRFWHLGKPTIAAVEGFCLAGAFELALCDVTIASNDAMFGES